jgi:predicted acylesterase/phospholipase RssA
MTPSAPTAEVAAAPFKILSLDGGGYKGLYTASVLAEIEAFNKPIAQHFDLICGTSIGGLIALSLAAGRPAAEIKRFFLDWGERIFPRGSHLQQLRRSAGQFFGRGKYLDDDLRAALESVLGDARMSDANSYLCIPTLNLPTLSPWVFKTDHDAELTRDSNFLMRDVARATSAAPTYFPVAEIDGLPGRQFCDGGLWANNPTLVGLVEAFRFFVGADRRYAAVRVLSIGTVDDCKPRSVTRPTALSIMSGGREILTATLAAQERAVVRQVEFLRNSFRAPVEVVRIPSPTISPDQLPDIGLDVVTSASKNTLLMYGEEAGQAWNRAASVTAFFDAEAAPPVFRLTP